MTTSTAPEPNRRILIVDDNTSIHEDFREILCPDKSGKSASQGLEAALFGDAASGADDNSFELHSAFQGQEALQMVQESLAQNRPYAMAFVDVRMPPGWDGIETIARIWEVCPALQVVVCTAYADYSWEEMRRRVGQPDSLVILKKPFDNIEVQQLAHALTKKWRLNLQSEVQLRELAQTNASLALSEQRFSTAFRESPMPSAIQTFPDQRFVDVNDRFTQVTGFTRKELIGRTPADLFLWDTPAATDEWYRSLERKEIVREQPGKIRTSYGDVRELLVSLSLVAVDGCPHALVLAQDISERVLLESQLRQAQKMEAIGQLAAGVAHDFNNVLTVIQGHADLLRQQYAQSASAARCVEQITHASSRAATLVRQLLMFSRKQVMQFRTVDLNEILSNTARMLARLVGEQVEIALATDPKIACISADASMVEQIAMNLAVNARDAMPNGGRITIRTAMETVRRGPIAVDPDSRDGEFVCLTFCDTGSGMDTQVLNRIFEPFFTTKPPGKGTGLGLSTVFGIVRQHRGWLEVESKVNHGSTFKIFFPATQQVAEKSEQEVNNSLDSGSETVLVAEDEEALRQMVVEVLTIQGYNVLQAGSGPEAIEVWEQAPRPIDLLVTDMVMPGGMMGSELAERLLDRAPNLKVIYTSGYSPGMADNSSSVLAQRNFLPKPFSIVRLARFVRECLDSPSEQLAGVAGHSDSASACGALETA